MLEILNLLVGVATGAVFADVILNRVVDLLQSVLLVPSLLVILIDDHLHVFQSLLLPLLDFARKFVIRATAFREICRIRSSRW